MKNTAGFSVGAFAALAIATTSCQRDSGSPTGPGLAADPPRLFSQPAEVGVATAPVGVTAARWTGVIEAGHFKYHNTGDGRGLRLEFKTNLDTDFTISSVVVAPGGQVGWHTHNGPVFISIRKGTLTLLEYRDGACERRDVGPGGLTILEQGTGIHNGYNLTGQSVEYATVAWAPRGVPQRVDISPGPDCTP